MLTCSLAAAPAHAKLSKGVEKRADSEEEFKMSPRHGVINYKEIIQINK
jgi:hypothetical protein